MFFKMCTHCCGRCYSTCACFTCSISLIHMNEGQWDPLAVKYIHLGQHPSSAILVSYRQQRGYRPYLVCVSKDVLWRPLHRLASADPCSMVFDGDLYLEIRSNQKRFRLLAVAAVFFLASAIGRHLLNDVIVCLFSLMMHWQQIPVRRTHTDASVHYVGASGRA